jgi:hypothetical protein
MKKVLFYGLVLLATSLALVTCNDENSGGIKITDEIIVKTKAFETYLHLDFVDAQTGEYLRGKKVTVTVSGKDAEAVSNNIGSSEETYTSENGMFDLVVDPTKASSDFVIRVSSPGYNDFTHHARLYESKFTIIRVALISLTNPPEGVTQAPPQVITVPATGITQAPVSVPVNSSNAITIPEGSVLKDAEGNVVTGEIESKVLFFDPVEAQEFFPGGLDVQAVRPDGEVGDISFTSAGLFDIELESEGTQVRTIEGEGLELTSTLDPSLINPNTGQPVAENDEIEMWSMDPETGVWQFEKTAVVKRNASGLYLQEKINHLSTWNFDWFTNSCTYGAKIKWTGNASPYTTVKITNQNPNPGNYYSWNKTIPIDVREGTSDNIMQFMYAPQNTSALLTFEGEGLIFEPATLRIPNLCDATKTYTVKVIEPNPASFYQLNIHLDLHSKSDANRKFYINGYAYLYLLPSYASYQYASISDGTLQTELKAGAEYDLSVGVGSIYAWGYVSVTEMGNNKLKVTFSPQFAQNYSSGSYASGDIPKEEIIVDKPSNGVIDLNMSFAVDDKELAGLY